MGICQCVSHSLCRMVWGCIACWFSSWEFCCTFLCYKLLKVKRVNRRRRRRRRRMKDYQLDTTSEESDDDDETFSYHIYRPMEASNSSLSGRWRDYRGVQLRKSLRPRSHRIKVGIARDSLHKTNFTKHGHHHVNTLHDIRVTHTSKFAHKGSSFRGRVHRSRRSV